MHKNYSMLFLLAVTTLGTLYGQGAKEAAGLNVQEISMSKWNTPDGLSYKEVPGVNLGVTSFEKISESQIAFLSNATNEIRITNTSTGKVVRKFTVCMAPRDFAFDNGFFYVLGEREMIVYTETGTRSFSVQLRADVLGVERICRYGNATYLLLPSGNSLKIESGEKAINESDHQGWITSSGQFASARIEDNNRYSVHISTAEGKNYDQQFSTEKHVAGIYVLGSSANRIYFEVQSFVSESPIQVERKIIGIELKPEGALGIVTSLVIPDCYYVLSNNDIHTDAKGNLLQMVTAPQGVYVYSLQEVKTENAQGYPAVISGMKYHFNDHLLSVEEK